MESKKAAQFIKDNSFEPYMLPEIAITAVDANWAVDLAEQEAAEKHQKEMADFKETAIDAHRLGCGYYDNNTMKCMEPPYFGTHECDDGCVFMEKFKELIK